MSDQADLVSTTDGLPKVCIAINNHNYAAFVQDAIQSALDQTYRNVEVVVVDDGSTDDSMTSIDQFANRVEVIAKSRGGQASALNRAFMTTRSDYVCFLDADDILDSNVIENVVTAFASHPTASRIQFQLEYADSTGQRLGKFVPARKQSYSHAHLLANILKCNDDFPWSPMSGNAYRVSKLNLYMPIPEASYPIVGADSYLLNASALFGSVITISRPGGRYRLHDRNWHLRSGFDPTTSVRIRETSRTTHDQLRRLAFEIGLPIPPQGIGHFSLTLRAHSMIQIATQGSPWFVRRRNLVATAFEGVGIAIGRKDLPRWRRLQYIVWFTSFALAPKFCVPALSNRIFRPLPNSSDPTTH